MLTPKEEPGRNKARLYHEDLTYREWLLPEAGDRGGDGRDGTNTFLPFV